MRWRVSNGAAGRELDTISIAYVAPLCAARSVQRVLGKLDGVDSYEVSLEKQQAVVRGKALDPQAVLEKVAKTGKKAELVSS